MAKRFQTLNIGAANLELAEYEVGGKGALTLVGYGIAALAAPLEGGDVGTILSSALQEAIKASGIRPGSVAVSVSGQLVFPRLAAIPAAGGSERFEQLVKYEIEQNIPFPIDELVCDRQVLGDTENGDKSVLIVAAKVDQIEAITSAVASVGFQPEIVDAAPVALVNALYHAHAEDGCVIVLDIGAKTSSLAIAEGDRIYNRSIPVAGNLIDREIANALGCTPDEAAAVKMEKGYVAAGGVTEDPDQVADLVSKSCRAVLARLNAEINRSINFYRSQQGGNAPTKLYLTGGSSLLPQIDQFFMESLGIDVEYLNPFEAINVGAKVDATALESDGAMLAASAGLAVHFAEQARFAINLLPPTLLEARAEKAKVPFIAAAGVALLLGLGCVILAVRHQTEVIVAQRDAVIDHVSKLDTIDKRVQAEMEQFASVQAAVQETAAMLSARSAAVRRLTAVRDSLVPGMWIEKLEPKQVTIRYWKDRVKVAGGKGTVGEHVAEKLKTKAAIVKDSVKISSMSEVGKNGQVAQVAIDLNFN